MFLSVKKWLKHLPLVKRWLQQRQLNHQNKLLSHQLALAVDCINTLNESALNDSVLPIDLSRSNTDLAIVVSLTSYGERAAQVHHTILSLLNQSYLTPTIVLWLADDEFSLANLPQPLTQLLAKVDGERFQVRFCDDIRSFKKLIPTLELFPCASIVTMDDDVIYPYNHLEKLVAKHREHPNVVVCHHARLMKFDVHHQVLPYHQWSFVTALPDSADLRLPNRHIFPVGIGGVLYPAGCFSDEVLNSAAFMQLCPAADDLWFKLMAQLNDVQAVMVDAPTPYSDYLLLPGSQDSGLWAENKTRNDQQLLAIVNAYPNISFGGKSND